MSKLALGAVGVASAAVQSDSSQLREAVTAESILVHEQVSQDLADANGDTRASGTPGYDASANYVAAKLDDAGYDVTRQEFDYELFIENTDPVLDPTNPDLDPYTPGEDFETMDYPGTGDVEAHLRLWGPSLSRRQADLRAAARRTISLTSSPATLP